MSFTDVYHRMALKLKRRIFGRYKSKAPGAPKEMFSITIACASNLTQDQQQSMAKVVSVLEAVVANRMQNLNKDLQKALDANGVPRDVHMELCGMSIGHLDYESPRLEKQVRKDIDAKDEGDTWIKHIQGMREVYGLTNEEQMQVAVRQLQKMGIDVNDFRGVEKKDDSGKIGFN